MTWPDRTAPRRWRRTARPAGGPLKRRGSGAARAVLAALACSSPLHDALASPWNRPAGQGIAITDYTFDAGATDYDAHGRLVPASAFSKGEASFYVEYGATDRLTLIARPSYDSVRLGPAGGASYTGVGAASLGAQWQALVFGPAVLAVQGSFTLPGSRSSNPALVGNTAAEGEARVLGGVALPLPMRPFLDLQTSLRLRTNGAAPQWHGDATFGFYPTDRLLVLAQSFTTVPLGKGDARNPSARWTRLEVGGVFALTQAWAVHLSVSTTVLGCDALRARGFSAGIWHYF